jgi:hypothetical protein
VVSTGRSSGSGFGKGKGAGQRSQTRGSGLAGPALECDGSPRADVDRAHAVPIEGSAEARPPGCGRSGVRTGVVPARGELLTSFAALLETENTGIDTASRPLGRKRGTGPWSVSGSLRSYS